jgi:hypothetical protein
MSEIPADREAWFVCDQCGWRSPSFDFAPGDDVFGGTREEFCAGRAREDAVWTSSCKGHEHSTTDPLSVHLDHESPGLVRSRRAMDARRAADREKAATEVPETWTGFELRNGHFEHYCRSCSSAMGAVRSPSGIVLCKRCFRSVFKIEHVGATEGCPCCENWVFGVVDVKKLIEGQAAPEEERA